MSELIVKQFKELIETGIKLAPLGGFDYSGYNARLQNKYLEWRRTSLEVLELSGPIGFPYKQKILSDAQGGLFYQSSVQLILTCLNELYEKLKASPDLITVPAPTAAAVSATVTSSDTGGKRILKPPPKPAAEPKPQPEVQVPTNSKSKKVYVIGELDEPLCVQLLQFLHEIGLEEVNIEREYGKKIPLDLLVVDTEIKFAFFVIHPDDVIYAMFEIGHFVGKLGNDRVCVIHGADVNIPKSIPGVITKMITVKLEEASFGILKDLKAAGYEIKF